MRHKKSLFNIELNKKLTFISRKIKNFHKQGVINIISEQKNLEYLVNQAQKLIHLGADKTIFTKMVA